MVFVKVPEGFADHLVNNEILVLAARACAW
jgi:hypothetical protein